MPAGEKRLTEPHPKPSAKQLPLVTRWLLMAFAVLCLGLAVIGIFLPVMPTVVFVLLAAWAAARSSPKMEAWMLQHRLFGPMLRDWNDGGYVSRRAKWMATIVMSGSAFITWVFVTKIWVVCVAVGTMACVLVYLWRRPERVKAG
jgi:uncharacterized membrane protein YbaN (DUF454 family)